MVPDATQLEALIETFPNNFWDSDRLSAKHTKPVVGSFQIMTVETIAYLSSNFRLNSKTPTPQANNILQLRGTPAPGSDVTSGHIIFVPQEDLQLPRYVPEDKRIDLWMRDAMLPMVMHQMTLENRYLWIGWFPDGHVYGDIHSV